MNYGTLFIHFLRVGIYNIDVNQTENTPFQIGGTNMKFEKEAHELYNAAHSYASRSQRGVHPEVLSSILDQKKISHTVNVGIMNIPVDKIVGVVTPCENDRFYTPDFLPLAPANSEFAEKWRSLYLDYLSDEGIQNPIGCYEYLGRFYVMDGMKRVSVLKCHGATTISAQVIRLIPVESKNPKIQRYNEFLKHFQLTGLYQVSFNNPENFVKLQKALGYEMDHVWTEKDRFSFLFNWHSFDRVFKRVFRDEKHVTAADVLVAVLDDYSYDEVGKMHPWELECVLEGTWEKLFNLSGTSIVDENKKAS